MQLPGWLRRPDTEPLILVSNREPFVHTRGPNGEISSSEPAGGLTSALQPLMSAAGGTWVAWGSGSADFEVTDAESSVGVPPDRPTYRLRRLQLSEEEVRGYYIESANRTLWPLCHSQLDRLTFDAGCWEVYRKVNERFAAAVRDVAAGRPATVWIQDYHLAMVPGVLRRDSRLFIHHFWHIPWPGPDILRMLPVAASLLAGLLGNDLLVFQTARDRANFLGCVQVFLPDARVDMRRGVVNRGKHRTTVRAHPISIDVEAFEALAARADVDQTARSLRRRYLPSGGQLLLGVDRIDYTKGIPRRFRAFERLLEEHPDQIGRVVFMQIAVPSRQEVPDYAAFEEEVATLTDEINTRFARPDWRPIELIRENYDTTMLAACYRAADICLVSPLQDGMNLVAKEFVACQKGGLGILVLSRFAGAAEEMDGAILVNPYDASAMAGAFHHALAMPPAEREWRLARMREQLREHTIYDWMNAILQDVSRLRRLA
ncbi:MAG: trehalose-6-phosphate synthase [Gemmatimonadota bacterium]